MSSPVTTSEFPHAHAAPIAAAGSSSSSSSCWWSNPIVSGIAPSPRHGHSAAYCSSSVWIFGGVSESGAFLNDLHRLQLDAEGGVLTWQPIDVKGDKPTPRAGSILITLGLHTGAIPISPSGVSVARTLTVEKVNKLLLYSGATSGASNAAADAWILDLYKPEEPHWYRVHSSGNFPTPRHHAAHRVLTQADCSLPRLLVSGGESAENGPGGELLDSTYILDLATWTWSRADTHPDENISSLARSSAVATSQAGRMVMFGGRTSTDDKHPIVDAKTLLFDAHEAHSPAFPVNLLLPPKVSKSTPAARVFSSLTSVRSDGVILAEEYEPNTLAPNAVQRHDGALFKRLGSVANLRSKSNLNETNNDGPGAGGPASTSSSPAVNVRECAYLIGGCTSLGAELRMSDVWRVQMKEVLPNETNGMTEEERKENGEMDIRVTYQMVMPQVSSSSSSTPFTPRADHTATTIPSIVLNSSGSVISNGREGHPSEYYSSTAASPASVPSASDRVISRILVFGGSSAPHQCLNDVRIFEVHWNSGGEGDSHSTATEGETNEIQEPGSSKSPAAPGDQRACCVIL